VCEGGLHGLRGAVPRLRGSHNNLAFFRRALLDFVLLDACSLPQGKLDCCDFKVRFEGNNLDEVES
jgi:hypothetical protein